MGVCPQVEYHRCMNTFHFSQAVERKFPAQQSMEPSAFYFSMSILVLLKENKLCCIGHKLNLISSQWKKFPFILIKSHLDIEYELRLFNSVEMLL